MIKNKKILCLFIIFFMIIGFTGCKSNKPSEENEVIDILKSIDQYTSDIDLKIKNHKQTIEFTGKQTCIGKENYKLKLNDGREFTYKNGKIYVKDLENHRDYQTDKDFDNLYKMSFIPEYVKLLYTNEEIKFSYKTVDEVEYLIVKLDIPYMCKNLCKAEMYLNYIEKTPYKVFIYDDKGEEKVEINYKNFSTEQ